MKRPLVLVCWLMVMVLPLDAVAADSVGMLTSVGTVLVDNQPASVGGAVFAGEMIETKARSKAVVTGRGNLVSLGENSSMLLTAKDFELKSGAVLVSSTFGVVRFGNLTITADSATPSRFMARDVNGELEVLALEGTVLVSDGQNTTSVPATKGVHFPKVGKPSWLLNDDIGILIVVAAAIAAGVTLGVVNAKNARPVSPAVP